MKLLILIYCTLIGTVMIVRNVLSGTISCSESKSCQSADISTGLDNIRCAGSESCTNATLATSNGWIYCDGSYACEGAQSIVITSDAAIYHDIDCNGLFSCANVESISNQHFSVDCRGEQSCVNTNITAADYVYCRGDSSCRQSHIAVKYQLYADGSLSALDSVLYSNNSDYTVDFLFRGYESGHNATVICGDGHSCEVKCYGNGCANLQTECVGSCTLTINCDSGAAQYDEINCPNGYTLPSNSSTRITDIDIPLMPSLLTVTISTHENSRDLYNRSNFYCGDYQDSQCYNEDLSVINESFPVCCLGYYSCGGYNISMIDMSVSNQLQAEYNITPVGIRCDGRSSCLAFGSYSFNKYINIYGGNAYFAGSDSIDGAVVTIDGGNYDVFCTALYACGYADGSYLLGGDNVYCTASASCTRSTISNFNNVVSYGSSSSREATIKSVGNVYCGGHEACEEATITNISDTVYGNNWRALHNSNISNVGNSVIGLGFNSLSESTIYNVSNVYCTAAWSCEKTYMRGIHSKIIADGYGALRNSVIVSESNWDDFGELFISISGTHYVEPVDIYCNETDVCKIECLSFYACTSIIVHCLSSPPRCFVSCDPENGISCPSNNSTFNHWIQTPTTAPSVSPTIAPSVSPTAAPSVAPTSVPTASPTLAPTGSPTLSPSNSPTIAPTEVKIERLIYLYYNDPIDDPLSLNIRQYADNLANGTAAALKILMNDTTINSVCATNETDPSGIACDLSNWNPFSQTNIDNNRRMMLHQDYSYHYEKNNLSIANGWWQARISNLQFCVVLDRIEWDSNSCQLYDQDKPDEEETIVTQQAQYVAFGTFDVIADENVDQFDEYFQNKLNQNSTIFGIVLDNIMNKWFELGGNAPSFELKAFTIETVTDPYVRPTIDTFAEAALDLTFGLYGFMLFCVIMAIVAKFHAFQRGADNVKSMNIVFFGIWVWDFVSDLIFSARAFEQKYYIQGTLGLIFVLIPWIVNVYILIQSQKKWTNDNSIKFGISIWLLKYNKKLIFLTIVCGSAFAAIDLCNSRAFGMCCTLVTIDCV